MDAKATTPMNGLEFKEIRAGLGLSQRDMADVLDLGAWGHKTVRRWENEDSPISGPLRVAMRAMKEGHRPEGQTFPCDPDHEVLENG